MITEKGRLTKGQIELPEHIQEELNRKFALLYSMIDEGYRPEVTVSYFVPDKTKEGGSYESYTGDVKKVDSTFRTLTFFDMERDITGKVIDIGMITSVESTLFAEMM